VSGPSIDTTASPDLVPREVPLVACDPRRLSRFVRSERVESMLARGGALRDALGDARVLCVNSTAAGGGVAEMLIAELPYVKGVGIDIRWLVIQGDPAFFAITKRIHNHLYGTRGDGGALGQTERRHYEEISRQNAMRLTAVRPGDVVILHDPQTAGLAPAMRRLGARVVWRSHVGTDVPNENTERAWAFLRPYIDVPNVEAFVVSRRSFAPEWMPNSLVAVIPPAIDPFAPKNEPLEPPQVRSILAAAGVVGGKVVDPTFTRANGEKGRVGRGADVVRAGPAPDPDQHLVVQISRWDRLKDMLGVLRGFADHVSARGDAQLVLAGPAVTAVADDPEGAVVLAECQRAWQGLPDAARLRIQLACLPMADREENAAMVNALQHHAFVVVQKSLAEGFGLTVSEAMFNARPVVASAVGGITDQVVDGKTGILLGDPADLVAFGAAVESLLDDPSRADAMGAAGRGHVIDNFLPDTHLARWTELVSGLAA
jgi:trehalose synthase